MATITCFTFFSACKTTGNKSEKAEMNSISSENIPFNIAKNYFTKNTVPNDFITLRISTQGDFDKYFGQATTMGQNGVPTPIDFSEGYVIAIINKESDRDINITPESLTRNGEKIDFLYTIKEGEKQTFTSRTMLILIVNNEYIGDINFIKQ